MGRVEHDRGKPGGVAEAGARQEESTVDRSMVPSRAIRTISPAVGVAPPTLARQSRAGPGAPACSRVIGRAFLPFPSHLTR